jgi:NAD(P)-dependent dehydrogenase (short-subunit alcohol dehydrogenase family)
MTASLAGRVALVTGATSGIGRQTAVELAARGATVVMVARDRQRGAVAKQTIRRMSGSEDVELLVCDLLSQKAVQGLAEDFRQRHDRLDILVNNAGAVYWQRGETEDGIERTLAVNYLSAFLLTTLLLEPLADAAPSRVVNVVSRAHRGGHVDFDDLQGAHDYQAATAYGQAKLALVLFTYELAARLDGLGITVNCVEPGRALTRIDRAQEGIARLGWWLSLPLRVSPRAAARSVVKVATDPALDGISAEFFDRWGLQRKTSNESYDPGTATRLWRASEQLITLTMPAPEEPEVPVTTSS